MKRFRFPLLALLFVSLFALQGCSSGGSGGGLAVGDDYKNLAGVWQDDDTKTSFTFVKSGDDMVLASAIDDDGEVFNIHSFEFLEGRLSWTYEVPSTGYFVTIIIMDMNNRTMNTVWGNSQGNSGTGTFTKVK